MSNENPRDQYQYTIADYEYILSSLITDENIYSLLNTANTDANYKVVKFLLTHEKSKHLSETQLNSELYNTCSYANSIEYGSISEYLEIIHLFETKLEKEAVDSTIQKLKHRLIFKDIEGRYGFIDINQNLECAVAAENCDDVKLLLENGADPNYGNVMNNACTADVPSIPILQLLLQSGANPQNISRNFKRTKRIKRL